MHWASENITLKRIFKKRESGPLLKLSHKPLISTHFTCKCIAIISGTTLMCPRFAFTTFDPFLPTFAVRKQLPAIQYYVVISSLEDDLSLMRCRNGFADFNLLPQAIPVMLGGCGSSLGEVLLTFFFSSNSRSYVLNITIYRWLFSGLCSHILG